jgi:DNA/RNA endonuclease YhcR with UshA esterase domain
MHKYIRSLLFVAISLSWTACSINENATLTPSETIPENLTSTSTPVLPDEPTVVISELLTGIEGNNNYEYIELYNTGDKYPLDLKGWSLGYKLADNQEENKVYSWDDHALIPPLGHYLLVHDGQDVGIVPDATFDVPMIPQRGSLRLHLADGSVLDSVTWGSGSFDFTEGDTVNQLQADLALERKPGGGEGNWIDTNDNTADFLFAPPNPQGVGSTKTPAPKVDLSFAIQAPDNVNPGGEFEYVIVVENDSSETIDNISAQIPIDQDLEVINTLDNVEMSSKAKYWELGETGGASRFLVWNLGSLESGKSASTSIKVQAPWTYKVVNLVNYSVQADNLPSPIFGSPIRVSVEGGAIPIGVLKDLVGNEVVIEGTATMYTGGLYAGTGNTKFYLEDNTGGVQVWVPSGDGIVDIGIGASVRVRGSLEVYRGALELVINNTADVEVKEKPTQDSFLEPTMLSIGEAANDPEFAGKLVKVEGIVARNEEFSYSYEIDLIDETGQLITLYIDKQTNINVELIESGQYYKMTGILEILDSVQQLYPRVQADLERIFPPELTLTMDAPITALPGDNIEIFLTASNYTPDLLSDLVITATLPKKGGVQFVSASDGHEISGSHIIWSIPQLKADGAQVTVSYTVEITSRDEYLKFENYTVTATEWFEPSGGDPYLVFIGNSVPIWAIQGFSYRSPYILKTVRTEGIVTGVFPDLGGFWIQETETDMDPSTSSGLFINTGEMTISAAAGNHVRINGIVRETYQQTQVQISSPDDIAILENGNSLPLPVNLDPPANYSESIPYYESLEGMLVQVSEPAVAVAPTSHYGEFVLVLSSHDVNRLWQGDEEHNGFAIMVDDGSSAVHENRSLLNFVVNTGDTVEDLIGPLAYTFGRYKIEPIVQPQIASNSIELPTLKSASNNQFRIMTWNVENLFDLLDPHPSSPDKPGIREYKTSIVKVSNTILAAGAPTVVGLQEVENIGILEDIADQDSLAEYQYQPFLIEGTDSRYIDNGYLVRGDVAEVVNVRQYPAPEGLTSRPPLEIEIILQYDTEELHLFVINNHFTSMSGGEKVTEPRRDAQAAWNAQIVGEIFEENPGAYVAVIGDLNSYYDSAPIDTLRDAGLIHVYQINPEGGWYSYIYEGESQTLDHILVSPNLFEILTQLDILHVNADYAPTIEGDESPMGKSDHDPVIATFTP